MSGVRFSLLGPPRVELDGVTLSLDTRKAVALLAYLAAGGSPATRATLAVLVGAARYLVVLR